jgi:hypothetical protein
MNWREIFFWRRPPIADPKALADFIDERSAFLVQKGINDYSRARAGHYTKVLLSDAGFVEAFERARWSTYPMGLAMVGELVEGVLRRAAADPALHRDSFCSLVLSVFDRYPAPAALSGEEWADARAELASRLQQLGLHPPKRAVDIPAPYARRYWDLMPIHKDIRTPDFPTTRSYLQVMLCNIHDELTKRTDLPAVTRLLGEAGVSGEVVSEALSMGRRVALRLDIENKARR